MCVCVCGDRMKILKKKKFFFFFFFFEVGIFFSNWEKKSPESHWERGQISAPEDTKKNPCMNMITFHAGCDLSSVDNLCERFGPRSGPTQS